MGQLHQMLSDAQFSQVQIEVKEESRAVIAQWMPGSGAENFVVSANITAIKPVGACVEPAAVVCEPVAVAEEQSDDMPIIEEDASG